MNKLRAGVIGATGYAGTELIRILLNHPEAEISALSSVSYVGKKLSDVYPSFYQICDQTLVNEDVVIGTSDVVFTALPSGLSEMIAQKCRKKGVKLIDMGADFRLKRESAYKQWYGRDFEFPELHTSAVYCIPELHRARIRRDTMIIGNPGCYPTSIALALAPAVRGGLVRTDGIVIDAKSGVSGSGRTLSQNTHFPECNESFSPYKVAVHRHTPEIEQTLREMSGTETAVTFVPHLLPVSRGIVSTVYTSLFSNNDMEQIHSVYEDFYKNEKFVRVLPLGRTANLKQVVYSNYCDISLHSDPRTHRLIIVSAIDNMVKGAAGQAIQNMNLLFGIQEDEGLHLVPPAV